ncbi:hypothetical protein ES703_70756 [subsurface metagenome]
MPGELSPEWTKHLKGDGVPPSVVKYYTLLPWQWRPGETIHIVTSLDCMGRSMQVPGRLWRFRHYLIIPGVVSYFDVCGLMIHDFAGTPNVFYDLRTRQQVIDLCCPPQLMLQFLETEGSPD